MKNAKEQAKKEIARKGRWKEETKDRKIEGRKKFPIIPNYKLNSTEVTNSHLWVLLVMRCEASIMSYWHICHQQSTTVRNNEPSCHWPWYSLVYTRPYFSIIKFSFSLHFKHFYWCSFFPDSGVFTTMTGNPTDKIHWFIIWTTLVICSPNISQPHSVIFGYLQFPDVPKHLSTSFCLCFWLGCCPQMSLWIPLDV